MHIRESAMASFTPQHIWICKCFPAQKALTSCYYMIPVGADTTAWKYIIGDRTRERRVPLDNCRGDVCTLLACVCGCWCACVSQRNVIMPVVFLYCSPEYEMCWVVPVVNWLITEGIKTFKGSKSWSQTENSRQPWVSDVVYRPCYSIGPSQVSMMALPKQQWPCL